MSNGRSVGVIAGSIVGLVAVAVVIVLLADRQAPQTFAPGSPEATIQTYMKAWDKGDLEAAYAQFTTAARSQMSLERFEAASSRWRASRHGDTTELVLIERSEIDGSRATVFVIVETSYGGGLENNTYRTEREVQLSLEDGAWRITDPLVWIEPADVYMISE